MGTSHSSSLVPQVIRERPWVAAIAAVGVLLFVDLLRRLVTGQLAGADLVVLLWRGIVNGLIIGLAGVGLSMTYSILNFANFAHGDYITAGAFGGWSATWVLAGIGAFDIGSLILVGASGNVYASDLNTSIVGTPLAIIFGLLVAGLVTVALALVIDRVVYKPMRGQGGISLLIASIGVAFTLRYLIALVYTTGFRSVASTPPAFKPTVFGLELSFGYHEVTLVVTSLALMLAVHLLLQRTKLGKAMRAMSDNKDLARITGIPTERVIRWTWILGAGLAGMAGYLFILESGTISFTRGWILLLLIFAAVIMGGIGSIYGAIAGGLIIGLTQTLSQVWIPSEFTKAAAFALMILILLYKPSGLFSGRTTA